MLFKKLLLSLTLIIPFFWAPPPTLGENLRGVTIQPGKNNNENTSNQLLGQPYENDWGLVIGINDYSHLPPLVYSVNDAQSMYETLLGLGFSKNHLHRLLNAKATQQAIVAAVKELEVKAGIHDRVFIFFAGHGYTYNTDYGEEGFLMAVDSEAEAIVKTGISMKSLQGLLKKIPAKHVLLAADSCYSGYAVSRGITITPNVDQALLTAYTQSPVVQVLTAGQKNQQVSEEQGHGIFTKYLIEGLQGNGDIDKNGMLTALELGQWVQGQVIRKTERRQIPMFGTLSGEGQYLLRWDLEAQPARLSSSTDSSIPDPLRPPIEKAASDITLAYKLANKPRIAVSFLDETDGQPAGTSLTTKLVENQLQTIGVRTIQTLESKPVSPSNSLESSLSGELAELSIKGKSQTTLSRKIAVEGYDFFFFTSQVQYEITRISTNEVIASGTVTLPKDEDLSALNREEAARQALEKVGQLTAGDIQTSLHDYWMTMQKEGQIFEVRLQEDSLNRVSAFQKSLASDPQIRDIQRRSFAQDKGGILEVQYQGTQNQFIASMFKTFPDLRLIQEGDHQISVATN